MDGRRVARRGGDAGDSRNFVVVVEGRRRRRRRVGHGGRCGRRTARREQPKTRLATSRGEWLGASQFIINMSLPTEV